jgi:hypothetical protein
MSKAYSCASYEALRLTHTHTPFSAERTQDQRFGGIRRTPARAHTHTHLHVLNHTTAFAQMRATKKKNNTKQFLVEMYVSQFRG